jgi:hypothetical protein
MRRIGPPRGKFWAKISPNRQLFFWSIFPKKKEQYPPPDSPQNKNENNSSFWFRREYFKINVFYCWKMFVAKHNVLHRVKCL